MALPVTMIKISGSRRRDERWTQWRTDFISIGGFGSRNGQQFSVHSKYLTISIRFSEQMSNAETSPRPAPPSEVREDLITVQTGWSAGMQSFIAARTIILAIILYPEFLFCPLRLPRYMSRKLAEPSIIRQCSDII